MKEQLTDRHSFIHDLVQKCKNQRNPANKVAFVLEMLWNALTFKPQGGFADNVRLHLCHFSGTGNRNNLHEVHMPTVGHGTCSRPRYWGNQVTSKMLCAGYHRHGICRVRIPVLFFTYLSHQGPWPISIKKCPHITFYHIYQIIFIIPISCWENFLLEQQDMGLTLRSLSLSYQKKDGRTYDTDVLEFESFDFIDHIL